MEIAALQLDPISRLSKDVRKSAELLEQNEIRYLVDMFYTVQNYRIRGGNQVRAMGDSGEPHALIKWSSDTFNTFESQIQGAMRVYARSRLPGRWLLSIHGIGPIIAAGLLAHIDIEQAPTVGHIWNFAGLNPEITWEKGHVRPWNARLKVLCWKASGSFVKQRASDKDFYGKHYEVRKAFEVERNESGGNAETARLVVEASRIKKPEILKHYRAGKLAPGHIESRARRWTVKLFLSHLHHVLYHDRFGMDPPKPFSQAILKHGHYIAPPNWPME